MLAGGGECWKISLACPRRMTCGIISFWTLTPPTPWVPCVKKKNSDFFVSVTSPLSSLTSADVSRISVDVIPEELFSTVREVQGALNFIKVRKFPGPDGIPNVLLQSSSFELAPVICELYNSSLRDGFIPPLLESACVRPLPKKRPV